MWDLTLTHMTRNQTLGTCIGSAESEPLDRHWSPVHALLSYCLFCGKSDQNISVLALIFLILPAFAPGARGAGGCEHRLAYVIQELHTGSEYEPLESKNPSRQARPWPSSYKRRRHSLSAIVDAILHSLIMNNFIDYWLFIWQADKSHAAFSPAREPLCSTTTQSAFPGDCCYLVAKLCPVLLWPHGL